MKEIQMSYIKNLFNCLTNVRAHHVIIKADQKTNGVDSRLTILEYTDQEFRNIYSQALML